MITYFLQTAIAWFILLGFYYFFLSKKTFFNLNRTYLLVSIGLGLVLPFTDQFFTSDYSIYQIQYVSSLPALEITNTHKEVSSINYLLIVYFIGFIITFARLLYGLFKIFSLTKGAAFYSEDQYTKIVTSRKHMPFSFFKWVFISNEYKFTESIEKILKHEEVHIKQWHSIDLLLVELLHCLFWFNPILILYKKAIKYTHEYIADELVAQSENAQEYKALLISQPVVGLELQLSHQFFQSQIKNRLKMLNKKKSNKSSIWLYTFMLPILFGMAAIFSAYTPFEEANTAIINVENYNYELKSDTIPPPPPPPPAPPARKGNVAPPPPPPPPLEDGDVFKVVEDMPRFPGCEDASMSKMERDDCAKSKMLQFLYTNIKYPAEARKNGVEGTAVVSFVIRKNGEIEKIKLLRDPGAGLGEESKRVVNLMNDMSEKWIPGKQKGKSVNVMYTLPIKFKLESGEKEGKKKKK